MGKIPVGATIGEAYRFAFARFFGNLGVVWAPVALVMLAAWYFLPAYLTFFENMASHMGNPSNPLAMMGAMGQLYRAFILFFLVGILMRAEMMLGLTRRALGLSTGPSLVFLSFGKSFWRLAGAYFSVIIILWVVEIVLVIGLALAGVVVGIAANIAAGGDKILIGLIAGAGVAIGMAALLCALLYIAVRLTFLLTPVIVAGERFDLVRPWQLAGGNFWRIFAIGIAVFVPVTVLLWIVSVPLYLGALWPLPHIPAGPQDMTEMTANMHALLAAMFARARAHWFVIVPLALASSALIYGIAAGAAASAYRHLVPAEGRAETV